jgi:hypothetical protein
MNHRIHGTLGKNNPQITQKNIVRRLRRYRFSVIFQRKLPKRMVIVSANLISNLIFPNKTTVIVNN